MWVSYTRDRAKLAFIKDPLLKQPINSLMHEYINPFMKVESSRPNQLVQDSHALTSKCGLNFKMSYDGDIQIIAMV